jgi:urea transport system ATP-binding protein
MAILRTENLSVEFNGFKALTDLNFTLEKDELRVILGPNGAGKTTFLDLISGKTKPTAGKIYLNGEDITSFSASQIAQRGLGRKFQGPNVFDNLTVFENIEVSLKGFHRIVHSLFRRKDKAAREKIHHILEQIGLSQKSGHLAYTLSHGEKQWLEMGMLLAQDPTLVILDEPTTGMTASETYKTGELIQTIFKGKSLIVVEHDMSFVRQIAKKVTVLHQGRHLAEGTLQEIENNPKVQEIYLKEDAHA